MLTNILKTALRSLLRHRSYSLISISGLAMGFACCMAAFLYVQHELSYDRYHEKSDRIFRIVDGSNNNNQGGLAKVNGPWGPAAATSIPEVESMTRFLIAGQTLIARNENRFYENGGFYTDSTLFDLFSFKVLQGDAHTALTQPHSILLTESLAKKYFNDTDPLGKTLRINNEEDVTVTAVIRDVPQSSHFTFSFLLSMVGYQHPQKDSWTVWNQYYTYLLLKPGASGETVASKFKTLLAGHIDEQAQANVLPQLQPLADIHLYSHLFREITPNSDVAYLYIFSGIGLLVLIISSINFINLSTARAMLRTKEVGIRKSSGAFRGQLIAQYLGESVLISLFSLVLSLGVLWSGLPYINSILNKTLSVDFRNVPFVVVALMVSLLVGFIAGSYPALFLAKQKPALVLKGIVQGGRNRLREALVVFQFAISAFLIVSVAIIYNQLSFIQGKKLGFNPSQLITIPINSGIFREKMNVVKDELLTLPGVESVSVSGNQPGGGDWGIPCVPEGADPNNLPSIRVLAVDPDFVSTFKMELAQGRDFSKDVASDSSAYLINEEAARQLGWSNPLEKKISMPAIGRPSASVIGVLKDFHFRSLKEKIGPVVLFMPPSAWMGLYTVRIQADQMESTLASIEKKWSTFDAGHPFTYSFFDQSYGNLYASERQLGKLAGYFTGIAIFIACLGLFSLAAFTMEQRTKEVGIRKVLGASIASITLMLSKDLVRLVIIGFVMAVPAGYYVMDQWLKEFAYRTNISPLTFLITGVVTLALAWLTVSYKVVMAGRANPVDSLRNE